MLRRELRDKNPTWYLNEHFPVAPLTLQATQSIRTQSVIFDRSQVHNRQSLYLQDVLKIKGLERPWLLRAPRAICRWLEVYAHPSCSLMFLQSIMSSILATGSGWVPGLGLGLQDGHNIWRKVQVWRHGKH